MNMESNQKLLQRRHERIRTLLEPSTHRELVVAQVDVGEERQVVEHGAGHKARVFVVVQIQRFQQRRVGEGAAQRGRDLVRAQIHLEWNTMNASEPSNRLENRCSIPNTMKQYSEHQESNHNIRQRFRRRFTSWRLCRLARPGTALSELALSDRSCSNGAKAKLGTEVRPVESAKK